MCVLQCVKVCCSGLQCVAVSSSDGYIGCESECCSVVQFGAVCCSVLQCVAVSCVAVMDALIARVSVEVCCSVLQ